MIDSRQGVASIGWAGDKLMLKILVATCCGDIIRREKVGKSHRAVKGREEAENGGRHVAE